MKRSSTMYVCQRKTANTLLQGRSVLFSDFMSLLLCWVRICPFNEMTMIELAFYSFFSMSLLVKIKSWQPFDNLYGF